MPRVALAADDGRSVADEHEFAALLGAALGYRAKPHERTVLGAGCCLGEQAETASKWSLQQR
ncbi:hypothetical protein [Actinoplanes regularis]|uniref:hypothetical protein n=1 Tax=Actinoplanes regularis TaxID=52697 RepID=UPI002554D9A3|nr:hypothetical protein [Actinoplanes regularis]